MSNNLSFLSKLAKSSEFNKSFAKLFSTGILMGVISALCIPIVSRIYTPIELGKFQLFLSMIIVFTSVSSFKYEMAIVLPKKKYQSKIVLQVTVVSLLVSTVVYSLSFYLLSEQILEFFNAIELKKFSWVIPLSTLIGGVVQIIQMCLVSDADFNGLSFVKGGRSITNNLGNIAIGVVNPTFSSLVISYLSSSIFVLLISIYNLKFLKGTKIVPFRILIKYALKYKKFPTVNTLVVLLNTISMNLPIFLLSKNFSFEIVGLFMMANRLIEIPISLVTNSLNQVYTKFASDDFKVSPSKLKARYISTLKKLCYVALIFDIGIVVLSIIGVENILGNSWKAVNMVLVMLMIPKTFQLLNSPLSPTLIIVNKQEIGLVLIAIFLPLRYLSLSYFDDFTYAILNYSVLTSFFYMAYNYAMFKSIR